MGVLNLLKFFASTLGQFLQQNTQQLQQQPAGTTGTTTTKTTAITIIINTVKVSLKSIVSA
jgi:hypothetical protein